MGVPGVPRRRYDDEALRARALDSKPKLYSIPDPSLYKLETARRLAVSDMCLGYGRFRRRP
jgi:hypothetical protein